MTKLPHITCRDMYIRLLSLNENAHNTIDKYIIEFKRQHKQNYPHILNTLEECKR